MQTFVLGIDPFLTRIEIGYPLLYPLISRDKLTLISVAENPSDPLVGIDAFAGVEDMATAGPWQTIILIPAAEFQFNQDTLGQEIKRIEEKYLKRLEEASQQPERIWVLLMDSKNSDAHPFGRSDINERSTLFDKYIFLRINEKQLGSPENGLPLIISVLAQFRDSNLSRHIRFYYLDRFSIEQLEFNDNIQTYQNRLKSAQKKLVEKQGSVLSTQIDLIDSSHPDISSHFTPHEELPRPNFNSIREWIDWKDETKARLEAHLKQGKEHLKQVDKDLIAAKNKTTKNTFKNIQNEIGSREVTKKSLWDEFKKEPPYSRLSLDWQERIKKVSFEIQELYTCRPNFMQRTGTILFSLLLLTIPLLITLYLNSWIFRALQSKDVLYYSGFGLMSCIVVALIIELIFRYKLKKLRVAAQNHANSILNEITETTLNNTSYRTAAFAFSAAEINLKNLKRRFNQIEQKKAQWRWFESELGKHLDLASKLSIGEPIHTEADIGSSSFVDIDRECSVPCSQGSLFSVPLDRSGGVINITMGTAESRIEDAVFPGQLNIHLKADTFWQEA